MRNAGQKIEINGAVFEVVAHNASETYYELRAADGRAAVLAFHPRAGWTLDRKAVASMRSAAQRTEA